MEEALAHCQEAVLLSPAFAEAQNNLGNVLRELGRLDEAKTCYAEALRYAPRHAGARARLATLLRGKLPDEDVAALRRLLDDPHLSAAKRSALDFGLAHVLDARGAYAEAGEHLERANALGLSERRKRGQVYDPADHARFVATVISTCTPAFFHRVRHLGHDTQQPIFIVGLPRSGTTLIEQILAGHSQMFGAGELRLGLEDFQSLAGDAGNEAAAFEALGHLDLQTARRTAQQHLDRLDELAPSALRVADLEGVARRMVTWCGLEWEPGCLDFHQGKRPVRTASVTQVRQPIYTTSVARWKHYEHCLAPLFDRLIAW